MKSTVNNNLCAFLRIPFLISFYFTRQMDITNKIHMKQSIQNTALAICKNLNLLNKNRPTNNNVITVNNAWAIL